MTILVDGLINSTGFTNYVQQEAETDRLTIVDDPLGERGNVLKAYLVNGDTASGGIRAELSMTPEDSPSTSLRWYRFATLIQSSTWGGLSGNETTIWQSHDRPDGGDPARRPPIELMIVDGGYWKWRVAGGDDPADATNLDLVDDDVALYDFGQWVDWVMLVQYGYDGTGDIKIWKDSRAVLNISNKAIGYDDVEGNSSKIGLYIPSGMGSIASRTCYHTGIQLGESYSTFDQFMVACGSSATELEGYVTRGVSL
jgi:hypothetical protein